ncbi:hypothetical protein EVAR_24703_1, partial [Eumeta japonica]
IAPLRVIELLDSISPAAALDVPIVRTFPSVLRTYNPSAAPPAADPERVMKTSSILLFQYNCYFIQISFYTIPQYHCRVVSATIAATASYQGPTTHYDNLNASLMQVPGCKRVVTDGPTSSSATTNNNSTPGPDVLFEARNESLLYKTIFDIPPHLSNYLGYSFENHTEVVLLPAAPPA